nr:DNA cytosine methyltransferase [Calothrix sp. 336/3]
MEEHYILSKWLLTASDYGVPQKRQRAIWVGSKFGEVIPPLESDKKFTVGDAISDLSHIPINSQTDTWELGEKGKYAEYLDKIFTSTRLSDHPCNSTSPNLITGCKATAHTTGTQQKYTDTKPGEKEPTTWAYRLSADGFSPTLRAGSGNRTAARPIHYEHARVITVREAARLHSFPDWFNFGSSKLAAHKAIGNSVPPLLAYAIALALTSQFASQVLVHLQKKHLETSNITTLQFITSNINSDSYFQPNRFKKYQFLSGIPIFPNPKISKRIRNTYLDAKQVVVGDRVACRLRLSLSKSRNCPESAFMVTSLFKVSARLKSCIKNNCNPRFSILKAYTRRAIFAGTKLPTHDKTMPRIFDNIDLQLLPILRDTLKLSYRADFCVGYFNLRGWCKLDDLIEQYVGGEVSCCRLLVGMQGLPRDEVHTAFTLGATLGRLDNSTIIRLKKKVAEEFRQQLTIGAPTNDDEVGLRRLSRQLKTQKLVIKLFLAHPLHAKLYLVHRHDPNSPIVGFLGSSNLTLAGLRKQGELNVDILDHDATNKLQKWFDDRWKDYGCIDISQELAEIIDNSWAREELIPPYHIYLKIAYHLSHEAIAGISEFRIPREFNNLFDFQKAAVQLAARHVTRRGGVIVGDVVGLGKTLVGTALAKILQEDCLLETLIICPKNLTSMWQEYVDNYRLYAKVLPISKVQSTLPELRRYRIVLIDESHNLRNREGKRYRAIAEYITANESKCILLSATPYNKTYLDLSAQLRLFVPEDEDLGFRPEVLINQLGGGTLGELEFIRKHQCSVKSLAAFEKSEYADDWRELMKRYMVRRTRSFIKDNYAQTDEIGRKYLEFTNKSRSYFPERLPRTIKFNLDTANDSYSYLYSAAVVEVINQLNLPRYGLGNYVAKKPKQAPTDKEQRQLNGLFRGGRRLMGFSRTNLFKRLESSGFAFIQSLERHILRNFIYLYALEKELDIPIGTQDAELLDTRNNDEDTDSLMASLLDVETDDDNENNLLEEDINNENATEKHFRTLAESIYQEYQTRYQQRFKWLRTDLFDIKKLKKDLLADVKALINVLQSIGEWQPKQDEKINKLVEILTRTHPQEKILIFTQFADSVRYITENLQANQITNIAGVTGASPNPTELTARFSPVSNGKQNQVFKNQELRILVATDILSEGHNLQDCAIIINWDLPWAIIRLIQRAGRVDRIGQNAEKIFCYSFLPADGVERIINLRGRLKQRLQENAEVVGTDEAFFEDDDAQVILDLYNEKSGILDGEEDTEVDLTSEAFQIWKKATDDNPGLKKTIEEMSNVVYSTRRHSPQPVQPEGVLMYMKTTEGNDSLIYIDRDGNSVSQSQLAILKMATCDESTPAIAKNKHHHELVKKGAELLAEEEKNMGGQLGRPSGARFRSYERLKSYVQEMKGTLFITDELLKAIDDIYRYPLRQSALDTLNRQLRSGISNQQLAELVVALRTDDRLCIVSEEIEKREPQIICSLGLFEV